MGVLPRLGGALRAMEKPGLAKHNIGTTPWPARRRLLAPPPAPWSLLGHAHVHCAYMDTHMKTHTSTHAHSLARHSACPMVLARRGPPEKQCITRRPRLSRTESGPRRRPDDTPEPAAANPEARSGRAAAGPPRRIGEGPLRAATAVAHELMPGLRPVAPAAIAASPSPYS